jgi:hypothetical protein
MRRSLTARSWLSFKGYSVLRKKFIPATIASCRRPARDAVRKALAVRDTTGVAGRADGKRDCISILPELIGRFSAAAHAAGSFAPVLDGRRPGLPAGGASSSNLRQGQSRDRRAGIRG